MHEVVVTKSFNRGVNDVWEMVGGFARIADWHPAIHACNMDEGGQVRRLSLEDGGVIVERLVDRDEDTHQYSYAILESPLPLNEYEATIGVCGDDRHCTVTWHSRFDAPEGAVADVKTAIEGIYTSGLNEAEKRFR